MRVVLQTSSGVPIYEQIKAQVRAAILGGEVREGDVLPSIRQLARDLRVSVITTTRAYNDLAAEGLIANVQGKGTFVAPVDPERVRSRLMEGIRDSMKDAVAQARTARVGLSELRELLDTLWEER